MRSALMNAQMMIEVRNEAVYHGDYNTIITNTNYNILQH